MPVSVGHMPVAALDANRAGTAPVIEGAQQLQPTAPARGSKRRHPPESALLLRQVATPPGLAQELHVLRGMSKRKTVEDLKKLRDEIRVKVHLGGLEAKEWWEEFEPQLAALESSLATGVDKAASSADLIVQEFAEAFRRVRERMDQPK